MKRPRIESGVDNPMAEHDSYLEVFDDIADGKVDVNATNKKGCTMLMYAAAQICL